MNPYFLLDSISTEKIYIHQFTFSNIPVCYYISFHDTRARRCRDNRCIIFPIKQLHLPAISNGCVIYYLHEKDIFKTFFRHHNILIYCKLMHCPWHICEISSRNYFKSSESSCWFAWKCKNRSVIHNTDSKGFSRSDCDPVEYCLSRLSNDISNKIPFTYRDTTCRKY